MPPKGWRKDRDAVPTAAQKYEYVTEVRKRVEPSLGLEGDAFDGLLRERLKDFGRLTLGGFARAFSERIGDPTARLLIMRRGRNWSWGKVAELAPGEVEPDELEGYIAERWGPGTYQLVIVKDGKTRSPSSRVFHLGAPDDREESPPATPVADGEDVDQALQATLDRLQKVEVIRRLRGGEDEDMKLADLAQLLSAVRPDITPIQAMIEAANRRAEQAEQRAHELTLKLLDRSGGPPQETMGQVMTKLLEVVKPEVWQALLTPPEQSTNWIETVIEALKGLAPALQSVMLAYLQRAGVPVPSEAATLAQGAQPNALPSGPPATGAGPTPTPATPAGGGTPMPMQLNEEQQMAKDAIVEFVKAGDFYNAYAALEAFPGVFPDGEVVVPLGTFILSRIDPKVKAKVYVPFLAQVVPEFRAMTAQAEAFIAWVQQKLMADEEATRRAEVRQGPPEPRPTRYEDEEESV